ncbi:MAG: carbohydrate ABC transporter permease, partial [Planctomycetota bacterium]
MSGPKQTAEAAAERQAAADRRARRLRAVARILVIYGLLAGGAVIFTLPFVWMVGTSFKV